MPDSESRRAALTSDEFDAAQREAEEAARARQRAGLRRPDPAVLATPRRTQQKAIREAIQRYMGQDGRLDILVAEANRRAMDGDVKWADWLIKNGFGLPVTQPARDEDELRERFDALGLGNSPLDKP